jgi:hypothetical protein
LRGDPVPLWPSCAASHQGDLSISPGGNIDKCSRPSLGAKCIKNMRELLKVSNFSNQWQSPAKLRPAIFFKVVIAKLPKATFAF